MKNIVPNNIEEMSGNSICKESPGKHLGNTRERSIYEGFELKKHVLEKKLPFKRKHLGKVHAQEHYFSLFLGSKSPQILLKKLL